MERCKKGDSNALTLLSGQYKLRQTDSPLASERVQFCQYLPVIYAACICKFLYNKEIEITFGISLKRLYLQMPQVYANYSYFNRRGQDLEIPLIVVKYQIFGHC